MENQNVIDSSADINVRINALNLSGDLESEYKTKILPKNIVDDVNTLTQDMVNEENIKYVIKYNYHINGEITIPAGCILDFDGGCLIGGTIIGNQTRIVNLYDYDIFRSTVKQGTFKHITAILEI